MESKDNTFMNSLLKAHDYLCNTCYTIGGILLFFTAFTTSYDVFVRYFFNSPTIWSVDYVEYSLLFSTFLAAPWLLKIDGHVKVTFIHERLSKRTKTLVDIFNYSVGAIVCGILAWEGTMDTWESYIKGTLIVRPITIPKWVIMWVIPFGLFLLCTYFVRILLTHCFSLRKINKS